MKTIVRISKFLAVPFLMAVLFVGCGKSNDNSNNNTNPVYTSMNGACYNTQNNTQIQVPMSLCANNVNGANSCGGNGYNSNNGYNSGNGYNGYTSNNGYSGNGGYAIQQCCGTYIYQNRQVTCNGQNCSGYTLISQQTGQSVYCQ